MIQKLDPNKAHSKDMISIRMSKICGGRIIKLLQMIFKSCIENGISHFLMSGRKQMLFPFSKEVTNEN